MMIKLDTNFVSGEGGFSSDPLTYTQLARTETTAIYERSRRGIAMDYEIFRIRILAKGTKVFKTITEDDEEKYPGASQFGFTAWSYNDRTYALAGYEKLNREVAGSEEKKDLTIPVGEFTVAEFAEKNTLTYAHASNFIKASLTDGSVKFIREERRNQKGKPSKIYSRCV